MASTFSELKFELIGTGDQAGNWGDTTNNNLGTAVEQAITGLGNPIFTTDANLTISLVDSVALQTARALVLNITSSVSLTTTRELIVPTIEKQYLVQNNTTGGQSITVRTSAGTGITVPNGSKAHLYVDGVNVVSAVSYFSTLSLGSALGISSGGTGETTRQAAMDALAGSTTSGQFLRGNGTDVVMSAIQASDVTAVALTTGTISSAPVNSTDIVNKQYADAIASGIHFHEAVDLATTAALPANTYNNGASGVGATLTATANGALSVDSTAVAVGNRILVKNQVTQANNGVYVVTQTGSAGTPYILTRATDFDTAGSGVDQIDEGDFFLVTSGTVNLNTAWVQQTAPPITVGTTAIVFQQFSAPITYTAGTGLSESPTYTFNIANVGTAGTYGSASQVPVIVTNAQGQVTSVTNTTISIPNSSTTATSANTASAIVARDGSGNFSATTVTAALSGNATTASTLATARTIGGVSFNGSANIDLPGVNTAGNQNTSGTAANVSGVVAVANGGTGTATPSLVAGTNVTITGTFPNQTINASGGGGGGGDVTGPASSTANGIALFNGTTGKILKDSATTDGVVYGITVGRGSGQIASNTVLGALALQLNSIGNNATAIGNNALRQNTANSNTAVGSEAAFTTSSGSFNTAVGHTALRQNSTGASNTAVGYRAGYSATGGANNTAVGANALFSTSGSFNTVLGSSAMESAGAASQSTAVGGLALGVVTGSGNTALGYGSLATTTSGATNTGLGASAGAALTTGSTNTFLGYFSGSAITTGSKNTILGSYNGNQGGLDIRTSSNNVVLSDGDGNPRMSINSSGQATVNGVLTATSFTGQGTGITNLPLTTGVTGLLAVANGGTGTATPALVAGTNVTITGTWPNQTIAASGGGSGGGDVTGPASSTANGIALFDGTTGKLLKDSATADGFIYGIRAGRGSGAVAENTVLGNGALTFNSTGGDIVAVGYQASYTNSTGISNTAVGSRALYFNATGSSNTAIGKYALYYSFGSNNTAVGNNALGNLTNGVENIAVGSSALAATTANNSVAVGYGALFAASTGAGNIAIGHRSGFDLTTGNTNLFVGFQAGNLFTTGSKNTIIGAYTGNQGGLDIRTSSNNIVLSDGDGNPRIYVNSSGNATVNGNATINSTGALTIPVGTTAQRPASPVSGMIRQNSTTTTPEWYDAANSQWAAFPRDYSVQSLVIAGGGGGGRGRGGGGGAGGYRSSVAGESSGGGASAEAALTVVPGQVYTVTIGAGGAGGVDSDKKGSNGQASVFGPITAIGGGGGSAAFDSPAGSGGSGGGGAGQVNPGFSSDGSPGTSGQGFRGGNSSSYGILNGVGGGGAGAQGVDGNGSVGGAGVASSVTGSSVTRAGGGGGGGDDTGGAGGAGGGGAGGTTNNAVAGTVNTGGGGGGSRFDRVAGTGGSGIVILRYQGTQRGTGGTVTSSGGYTIHTFTSSGTYTA